MMGINDRRTFLAQLGLTVGAITVGRSIMHGLPVTEFLQTKEGTQKAALGAAAGQEIDFQYAPAHWPATYCFPDDPFKSLVAKRGDLLYGHPGLGAEWDAIPHIVSFGLHGKDPGVYINQKLESPSIPIITTDLGWNDVVMQLTSFATNDKDEGRIDNLLIEIRSKENNEVTVTPEILIASKEKFKGLSDDDMSIVQLESNVPGGFMA